MRVILRRRCGGHGAPPAGRSPDDDRYQNRCQARTHVRMMRKLRLLFKLFFSGARRFP
jgi:hypothetical protein